MLNTDKLFEAAGGEMPDEDILSRFTEDDKVDFPVELTDLDLWANYTNDDLYVMDKQLRIFLKKTRYKREKKGGYRTTASVIFTWIYGRKPEPKDSKACRVLHELLKYYCTSYTGATTYKGKKVQRVYEFSKYATENKRPYSMRLRLEEAENGGKWKPFVNRDVDPETKFRHGRRKHRQDGEAQDG